MTAILMHAGAIFACFVLLGIWALHTTLGEHGWFSRNSLKGKRRYWIIVFITALCPSICYMLITLHKIDMI
ncbi:MAG TPA: hypothetical protein DCR21_04120 [Succinivibrionaceae bacterium]|nr:hypothetical protein [Succinivibrionaceae bacterium]